ncbi:hypothetical protein Acor_83420 [Acrocarpospora corrugata]|uniref:Uncharacterized protein n=1 Tax=Acrocarpospora corrugata TaxID=35763 RepID=A0A5M3WGN5_9ACTN|nr:hypothetical protein [Acrocarpospora corrugata]GES06273.1 hypothetical protein Acor_83420 [Acrocarpospora corrugata]
MRKSQVTKLVAAAREHDQLARQKGYRADSESDRAMAIYQAARRNASPEELRAFERIYL